MMNTSRVLKVGALGLALLSNGVLAAGSEVVTPATSTFSATYKGGTKSCGRRFKIIGAEPADGARHPVFLYMVGTNEAYDNAAAMAAVDGMAARGYVAASIQYPNLLMGNCSQLGGRARCIFDASSADSAISAVCSRADADCDGKGIVVGGFSQGSLLATLAKDYEPRVAAAWGMGEGYKYSIYDVSACMDAGMHSLPDDRLRIADGVKDEYLSKLSGGTVVQTQAVTGLNSCLTTETSCYRSNGSGYHIVQTDEVGSGKADHCYWRVKGCLSSAKKLDPEWESGTGDWSLDSELDWLSTFTGH